MCLVEVIACEGMCSVEKTLQSTPRYAGDHNCVFHCESFVNIAFFDLWID